MQFTFWWQWENCVIFVKIYIHAPGALGTPTTLPIENTLELLGESHNLMSGEWSDRKGYPYNTTYWKHFITVGRAPIFQWQRNKKGWMWEKLIQHTCIQIIYVCCIRFHFYVAHWKHIIAVGREPYVNEWWRKCRKRVPLQHHPLKTLDNCWASAHISMTD